MKNRDNAKSEVNHTSQFFSPQVRGWLLNPQKRGEIKHCTEYDHQQYHKPLYYQARSRFLPVSMASASLVFHFSATSFARGSSGLGALSKAWIDNSTVRICRAGDHLSILKKIKTSGVKDKIEWQYKHLKREKQYCKDAVQEWDREGNRDAQSSC